MVAKHTMPGNRPAKRLVIIIGAAGGVGMEVAAQLQGVYDLVCTVRNPAQREMLRASVPAVSRVVQLDLKDNRAIRNGLKALLANEATDLAAVIVCAAMSPTGPLELAEMDDMVSTLQVNAVSNLAIYQGCIKALRRSKGRLIFIGSYSGKVGLPFTGLYAASKFALEGLVDVMRREVRQWDVNVILIQPGAIRTPMAQKQLTVVPRALAALSPHEKKLYGGLYKQFVRLVDLSYPTSTMPAEVAKCLVKALTARRPKTRYPIGPDARKLLRLSKRLSDRQLDAVCCKIFESVSRPGPVVSTPKRVQRRSAGTA
jgi:short-subunit dehydrogenase